MSHAANRPSSDEELPLRSIGALVSDISSDLSTLVRQEVELAKAEAKQSATQAGKGAGMLGAAAVAGQLALVFLSVAAWWALGEAIGRGWSGVVVAVVWAIIAAILASAGRSQLKKSPMGLPRTTETVKDIPEALKGQQTP
ncbi:phage holin family protein [Rothia sp. ARF10]|nr:phage holin family protein [Rothia sp. ARF10]